MMKIAFIATQREVVRFEIDNKIVKYFDKFWKGIQVLPKDDRTLLKMKRSGKKNIQFLVALILDANKGKNLKEYENCKADEEVANIIRKDCKLRGLIEIK